jgi:PAS domain S-box-containing protein
MENYGFSQDLGPQDVDELRARLFEAEETLHAIRRGDVDALLIVDGSGERVYTLRSADAPYRAVVEQMQEGAVTLNDRGDIVYSNRRFAAMVGMPLQQVIGASIDSFVAAEDRATLRAVIADGSGTVRTRLYLDDRAMIEARVSVSHAVIDETTYCTLIVSDVSTLTQVQRESRSKDEFLAMLAHELRNPLGAIEGAVQVLGLKPLRDRRAERAREVIHRQALHMARLVDDLLDVARVMTGKIELDCQRVNLAESVDACVAGLVSGRSVHRRIDLALEPAWVEADPVRLEQIVGNLLQNAMKFSPVDSPIRISVRATEQNAMLSVTDEGSGISPELLPHIFDLFVQADKTRDRAKGGLGIGLTLVRQLVELHGGTIEATSDGVEGSTFTVRLPIAAAPTLRESDRPQVLARPKKRILLVDDHADALEMYTVVLQADGHEIFQASDGAAAIDLFKAVRPDVAIVDIGLPTMDGYEVAKAIRAEPNGRDVMLIALTGYGFPEDRERAKAAGFDRHLVKPATPDDIRRELERAPTTAGDTW